MKQTKIETSGNCHTVSTDAIMTALVADGEDLTRTVIVSADGNKDEQLIMLNLTYADGTVMDVSIYLYFDGSWYSPCDWQGWQPQSKSEVKDCDWQLGVTGRKAVILGGAPRMLYGE